MVAEGSVEEEAGVPGPINNSPLIVPDHSSAKKLPSLTNEGEATGGCAGVRSEGAG